MDRNIINIETFQNVCATCKFWQGERNLDKMEIMVEVDENNRMALCTRDNAQRDAMDKCGAWEKKFRGTL